MIEVIMGLGNFLDKGKEAENRRNTDILITADTRPYGTMSFEDDAVDTIILRGEEAAREKWDELMALKASLGITDSAPPSRQSQIRISKWIRLKSTASVSPVFPQKKAWKCSSESKSKTTKSPARNSKPLPRKSTPPAYLPAYSINSREIPPST